MSQPLPRSATQIGTPWLTEWLCWTVLVQYAEIDERTKLQGHGGVQARVCVLRSALICTAIAPTSSPLSARRSPAVLLGGVTHPAAANCVQLLRTNPARRPRPLLRAIFYGALGSFDWNTRYNITSSLLLFVSNVLSCQDLLSMPSETRCNQAFELDIRVLYEMSGIFVNHPTYFYQLHGSQLQ